MADANFPPVNPIDRPNQYQKGFYPFSAFSSDDPNVTANPVLRLIPPWRFSAGAPIEPLSSSVTANATVTLPSTYPSQYQIYIPAAYLVAYSGGPYTLIITTGVSGKTTVLVPICKNGDTLLSGSLLFNIYVDTTGNVTSDAWSILASNARGSYSALSNGEMEARIRAVSEANGSAGAGAPCPYYGLKTWGFPAVFNTIDYVDSVPSTSPGPDCIGGYVQSVNQASAQLIVYQSANSAIYILGYAKGRWRT
jgi:hypothetical protein